MKLSGYWRLSSFYFFYFAVLGVLAPYWAPYLKSLGFSAVQIGNLMAIVMATKIVAPNIWGWIADHTGRPVQVVRLASFLSLMTYVGVFFGAEFWWLAGVMTLYTFFWNASLPQVEASTLNHLGKDTGRYGWLRLWGSLGFIVSVVAMGPVIDRWGAATVLPVMFVLLGGIFVASLLLPQPGRVEHHESAPLLVVLRRRGVAAFLLVCLLLQASHAAYYTFYTIYLSDVGYSKSFIGMLWALGVVSEIVVFLYIQKILRHFSLRQIWLFSIAVAVLRWLLIGLFPEHLAILVFAQVLHAFSFGAYHVTAIQLVHRYFRGKLQHRGQALYSSMSFGVGGAAGSLAAGYLWQWRGATFTFVLMAAVALAGLALGLLFVERERQTG
ncbi:MAG: MFS transporter [Gammaproteobacteria bacterium]|nr:MAG: MFS transporter [Gammaproteobacteria bacterium]